MQKYERVLTMTVIILFLLIMFLLVNITYRNSLIEEQQQKINSLKIELDSIKEKNKETDAKLKSLAPA